MKGGTQADRWTWREPLKSWDASDQHWTDLLRICTRWQKQASASSPETASTDSTISIVRFETNPRRLGCGGEAFFVSGSVTKLDKPRSRYCKTWWSSFTL